MKGRNINTHKGALDHLVAHLEIIGIDREKVDWVIKELDILKPNSMDNERACDVVVGYNKDKLVDLIEVKHSRDSRCKATYQLNNTQNHFAEKIGYQTRNKYVFYYPSMEYDKIK